jgi:hypothetical protein
MEWKWNEMIYSCHDESTMEEISGEERRSVGVQYIVESSSNVVYSAAT